MVSLLVEYRISDLSDAAKAINSYFIERPIDFSGKFYLYDVVAMKDPKTIYEVFLSDSLLKMLYLQGNLGDLDNIPDDFVDFKTNMTRENLHFIKYNNLYMGASLDIKNISDSELSYDQVTNIYGKLRYNTTLNGTISASTNMNDEIISSDLSEDELKKSFPKESFLKRYDKDNVVLLLPGEMNVSVATYLMSHTRKYFFELSPFLKSISLSLYFFNPISEIYMQAIFTYKRTIQGTLSFEKYVNGGFPLMYESHQFKNGAMSANFLFGMKIITLIWAIGLFLSSFFIVDMLA